MRRLLLALALGAALPARAQFDGGDATAILAKESLWSVFQSHLAKLQETDPDLAYEWGLMGGSKRLSPLDAEARARRKAALEQILGQLRESVRRESLGDIEALEYDLFEGGLIESIREIEQNRDRAVRPQSHLRILLLARILDNPSITPVAKQTLALEVLTEHPAVLPEAQNTLTAPPRIWTEQAILESDGANEYLGSLERRYPQLFAGDPERMRQAVKAARAALTAHENYLKDVLLLRSNGEFAIGEAAYRERFKNLQRVELAPKKILKLCKKTLEETKEELENAASDLNAAKSWRVQIQESGKDHPAAGELLSAFARESARMRAALDSQRVIAAPRGAPLMLSEPPMLTATYPLGLFLMPMAFDDSTAGLYYVAAPDPYSTPEQVEQQLASRFGRSMISVALAAEAWPGRETAGLKARSLPNSVRRVLGSDLFTGGWPLWAQEAAWEGHLYVQPVARLIQLRARLIAAVEGQLDVELHVNGMAFDEAVELLSRETDLDPLTAKAEVLRLTQRPTEAAAAVLGWRQLRDLRAEVQKRLKDKFTPKAFNDAVLPYVGLPPETFHQRVVKELTAR